MNNTSSHTPDPANGGSRTPHRGWGGGHVQAAAQASAADGGIGQASPPPNPVNWELLHAEELQAEWEALDGWVTWLRRTYGLPATVVPPLWHRHPELVWELSALHLHWLGAYHPDQVAAAPIGWHRDLADAIHRLRDWTATAGSRLDHDRPTRQTYWPGEQAPPDTPEQPITDRAADFAAHVAEQVTARDDTEDDLGWMGAP